MKLTAALGSAALFLAGSTWAGEGITRGTDPELALHLDFYVVEGANVIDGSTHGYTAKLDAGEIVPGRKKPAVRLDGHGQVTMSEQTRDLDPVGRALTVGAMCKPAALDGVIISMGDSSNGFSLYLKHGVPQFAVRVNGELHKAVATEAIALDQWIHLAGVIDPEGGLLLLANTAPLAMSQGALLDHAPMETLSIGADPGSTVGDYSGPMHWNGLVQDVRLYWGALSRENNRELLGDWADRPGCGCKK